MNNIEYKLKSKIRIKVTGRKVEYFLKRLMSYKIELLDIKVINSKEVILLIYKRDYERLEQLKSIYELEIVNYEGILKLKQIININKFIILFSLLGLAILIFLSNIIFKVEVVHNDKSIRTLLIKELANYEIEPKKLKKSFKEIEKIKKKILEKHREKIEWLEIENIGTKYIVKVEERKIIDIKKDYIKQNVVAKKSAIIKKVFAKNGVIVKNVDDYVKAGDVIISGEILLNETIKDTIKAEGEIFGEVWYNIKVEYPYIYSEKKMTGKKNNVFAIKFLNKTLELFNFNKYKDKIIDEEILLNHIFLPISFVKQKPKEIEIIEYVATEEEAINKALEKGRMQIKSQLNDNEYIISEKQLKVDIKESKIVLDIFYAVYENITDYMEIKEQVLEE
ncbi:MAG: hypothetical protein E7169_00460 [Firmicutes bacterium]|nr:hypothetical protein [Bacillota bacterium]